MFAPFGFCYSMQQGRFCGVIGDLPYKMAGWYHSALLAKIAPRVGFRYSGASVGVQGAEIDARAQQLRAGAWMLPEITDAAFSFFWRERYWLHFAGDHRRGPGRPAAAL